MTQEKQKVIRVLQPTKKPNKTSPKLISLSIAAVGIITASTLLFIFLPFGSDKQNLDQNDLINTENKTTNKRNITDTSATIAQDQEGINADGDVIHPQPKLNEITNIFRRQKEEIKVDAPSSSNNPFDSVLNTRKTDALPVVEKQKDLPNANNTKPLANTIKPVVPPFPKSPTSAKEEIIEQKSEHAKVAKQATTVKVPVTAQNLTTEKEKE